MTLKAFVDHIKHKSIVLTIKEGDCYLYNGTVGCYQTSLIRERIDKFQIEKIIPSLYYNDSFEVYVISEVSKNGY